MRFKACCCGLETGEPADAGSAQEGGATRAAAFGGGGPLEGRGPLTEAPGAPEKAEGPGGLFRGPLPCKKPPRHRRKPPPPLAPPPCAAGCPSLVGPGRRLPEEEQAAQALRGELEWRTQTFADDPATLAAGTRRQRARASSGS
ncbi:unnamed protein product [Prorocentrum cordatum]|uniref:Uncharacterized protein n=1 Tax=Prorocentrum cordatum TaxID=2364126 RepID=A0ABN9ULU5_9DINO|nr:unnamed protein product [Polarella glacialis]